MQEHAATGVLVQPSLELAGLRTKISGRVGSSQPATRMHGGAPQSQTTHQAPCSARPGEAQDGGMACARAAHTAAAVSVVSWAAAKVVCVGSVSARVSVVGVSQPPLCVWCGLRRALACLCVRVAVLCGAWSCVPHNRVLRTCAACRQGGAPLVGAASGRPRRCRRAGGASARGSMRRSSRMRVREGVLLRYVAVGPKRRAVLCDGCARRRARAAAAARRCETDSQCTGGACSGGAAASSAQPAKYGRRAYGARRTELVVVALVAPLSVVRVFADVCGCRNRLCARATDAPSAPPVAAMCHTRRARGRWCLPALSVSIKCGMRSRRSG